jgi:biotin carboxyl carrier protein
MTHKTEPFQIDVNQGQYQFEHLPEAAHQLDVVATNGDGHFHVLHNGQSVHADVEWANHATRTFGIRINGARYTVKIADHYDRLIRQLGLSVGGSKAANTIKAPMPGLVLNILVEPGQNVQKGDVLLILEAMKMENVLKAAGDGQIKNIAVKKGTAVEKGQLLIEME